MLAFQQLGGRCDIVSRADDSAETWVLRLTRGAATALLERERRRGRAEAGTTVYLADVDPDVLRLLTTRKLVDYLRTRRSAALARGHYVIEVVEGRSGELVTPDKPDGIKLDIPAHPTLWGRIEFGLYVAPPRAHAATYLRRSALGLADVVLMSCGWSRCGDAVCGFGIGAVSADEPVAASFCDDERVPKRAGVFGDLARRG